MEQLAEMLAWQSQEQDGELKMLYEERVDLLEKLITFLPPIRQMVMALYYKKGWNIAAIGRGMELSGERVQSELTQGLDFLTKIIAAGEQLHCRPKISQPNAMQPAAQEYVQQIFHLRYKAKLPFAVIASKLMLSPIYVQETYVQAHALLHHLRQTG